MSLRSILFSSMAVAFLLTLGTQPSRADDPNVDGMDHSQLNHGVLGKAASVAAKNIVWAAPGSAAPGAAAPGSAAQSDPDVTGMDHSRLNHGVLGRI
jgi:predicted secreted protein